MAIARATLGDGSGSATTTGCTVVPRARARVPGRGGTGERAAPGILGPHPARSTETRTNANVRHGGRGGMSGRVYGRREPPVKPLLYCALRRGQASHPQGGVMRL